MKAAVLGHVAAGSLVAVADVPGPGPAPGCVLVRVRAAALNRLDRMCLVDPQGEAPGDVCVADGAGTVVAVGPGCSDGEGVAIGDDVIIAPSVFWGGDPRVAASDYGYLGALVRGAHDGHVVVPARQVFPKPGHMSFAQAAALPLAGLTAWRALITRGRLSDAETVIVGAASSGVGTSAVQIASANGARVIAITSSPAKARESLGLGATATVDRTSKRFLDELNEAAGTGADLALDPSGSLWQCMVDVLRPEGRLVVVGGAASATGTLRAQSVYRKQVDVLGSFMGSVHDFAELVEHVRTHMWAPVVDSIYPLEDVAAAYERLDAPDRMGKVVLTMPHTTGAVQSLSGH